MEWLESYRKKAEITESAALYQAYSVGWSSENNPFSVAVGNKVKTAITVTDDEK